MFNKILFLKRDKDLFAKKIISELKKRSKHLSVISTDKSKVQTKNNIKFDFIFAFRSHHILKKKLIKKAKYAAINFHPGPPEYRGIGCVNYALYEKSRNYGGTAHLIDEKIDHRRIIEVKRFKITKNESVESLLNRTYKHQEKQAIRIIHSLSSNPGNLEKMLKKNKGKKWSKKIKKRIFLNKFYKINKNISRVDLKRKIRATATKKFKPYLTLHGMKFAYTE